MPHRTTGRFTFAGLCLLLILSFAVSGCGKKGPLYLPPAEPAPSQQ